MNHPADVRSPRIRRLLRMTATALLLVSAASALGDAPWRGAPSCEEIDLGRIEKFLTRQTERFGFYPAACNGSLYLIDVQHQRRMWLINESWWLNELETVDWMDEARADRIVVTASYVTGIGPTGAIPFRARIVLVRRGQEPESSDWVPLEPETFERELPQHEAGDRNAAECSGRDTSSQRAERRQPH